MSVIPGSHADLLERPLFCHLATLRADGTPHVNPMWFLWDGDCLSFTTSTRRAKYRELVDRPDAAVSINDPEAPYRYLEVRGRVERIEPDTTGEFFDVLAKRYGLATDGPVGDAPQRVRIFLRPTHTTSQ
ncbi:PPOX class F420-dependent oxidoreductase [Actinospica robiniae]|uniref:PPOX class F420-dependent oxidoreductase n=1 Tax=Actinospica robiniae TaxID=304901 RepID=UPI0005504D69|nr:PPOX class F420-dependent oxidoreductase [Actinospica robiniae]